MPASGPKAARGRAADHGLVVDRIGETEPRLPTAVPVGDQAVAARPARAAAGEFGGAQNTARHRIRQGKVQGAQLAVCRVRRQIHGIAEAEIQRKLAEYLPIVLNKRLVSLVDNQR